MLILWQRLTIGSAAISCGIVSLYAILPAPLKTLQHTVFFQSLNDFGNSLVQSTPVSLQDSLSVPEIARQVTVRILGDMSSGSGVIIRREGQTYTVLTNEHVLAYSKDYRYEVLTADGRTHSGEWLREIQFRGIDLALVLFRSEQSYQLAEMGNSNAVAIGDRVYAAGFPNWNLINDEAIESTRDWGLKAYQLTTGIVGMIPAKPLLRGYQLGYTNTIESGMSGGPVLDSNGRVIGINGRLKYPLQGIDAYKFADGTEPSEELFQRMEALSWAIPIATFQKMGGYPRVFDK